ncbi:MAG: GIY-YIG nuclease family protein [Eubacteriales bacterium]
MEKQYRKEMQAAYKERKIVGGICAIKNTTNGKMVLAAVVDLQVYENRFKFSQVTGSCLDLRLQKDWIKYGSNAFVFEVLEELKKKETQTSKEFNEDIKTLKEIWLEKIAPDMLY